MGLFGSGEPLSSIGGSGCHKEVAETLLVCSGVTNSNHLNANSRVLDLGLFVVGVLVGSVLVPTTAALRRWREAGLGLIVCRCCEHRQNLTRSRFEDGDSPEGDRSGTRHASMGPVRRRGGGAYEARYSEDPW